MDIHMECLNRIILKNAVLGGSASDIYVEGERIFSIEKGGSSVPSGWDCAEVHDCRGKVALPGFVNMHTHAAMSLMRGLGEDIPFSEWIKRIWSVESALDEELVYWGTKVACLEMIHTGTTAFNDHYWHPSLARRAASEMGLRPVISYVILDNGDRNAAERQKEDCIRLYEESLSWPSACRFAVAFHAIYSVSEEMMVWAADFAREHGACLHIHLSETEGENLTCISKTGKSPVEYLDSLGVLGDNTVAAHTLWLSEDDISILGKRHVNCVHNINSNLKLSSGYRFMYNELRDAGANLCIGTDGCASSNNLDMLEAMKTSALVQKAWRGDPAAMPLDELFSMATVNGARALGLDCGEIREGALADIILVDTESSFFLSDAPFMANFIYSSHSDCIDSVMCNGRFVMRNRTIEGEKEILKNAREAMERLK